MPAAKPAEFRKRAVDLAREGSKPIVQLARELGISESGLRRWMAQAEVDEGKREGLSSSDGPSWSACGRENRVLAMENEILKRAAAYFARENILPK